MGTCYVQMIYYIISKVTMAGEAMDVDVAEPSYTSPSEHLAPTTTVLSLSAHELEDLHQKLGKAAFNRSWHHLAKNTEVDRADFQSNVLSSISELLSGTSMKDVVIPMLHRLQAADELASFTENEIDLFQAGIEEGLFRHNWNTLLCHRMNEFSLKLPLMLNPCDSKTLCSLRQ